MNTNKAGYKIGKASLLSGISADKLRVWERRYAAITPIRSEAGGRLYSYDDILRLKLIKTLIDNGDSISKVAVLNLEELQTRVAEETQVAQVAQINLLSSQAESIRVAIMGESLITKMASANISDSEINIVASFKHVGLPSSEFEIPKVDILIIDQPALQEENLHLIPELMHKFNASHTIVVYHFASKDTLNRLAKLKCSPLRAPANAESIKDFCLSLFNANKVSKLLYDNNETDDTVAVPARRYDDATLVKIVEMSPVIKCECPLHLAELLFSLAAFEKYSSECENLNLEDSELHGYLTKTTAKARYMIENALDKVIEAEDFQI